MSTSFYAALVFVCRYLKYPDLTILLKVSSLSRVVVSVALARRVKEAMEGWVKWPRTVWNAMDMCDGVISGSFVIRLLDETSDDWEPATLDVYVTEAKSALMKNIILGGLRADDYGFQEWPSHERPLPAWKSQWREELVVSGYLEIELHGDPPIVPARMLRLFAVKTNNALDAIPYTWSTAHVNFLSLNYLVCAYPRATLHQRAFVVPKGRKGVHGDQLVTLSDRGYCIRDLAEHPASDGRARDDCYHYEADALRSLGDPQCLLLPIDRGVLDPMRSSRVSWPRQQDLASVSWQYSAFLYHDATRFLY